MHCATIFESSFFPTRNVNAACVCVVCACVFALPISGCAFRYSEARAQKSGSPLIPNTPNLAFA